MKNTDKAWYREKPSLYMKGYGLRDSAVGVTRRGLSMNKLDKP